MAALVAALTVVATSSAFAQTSQQTSPPTGSERPSARITLVGQDPWTPVGGDVRFRLLVEGAPPDATVNVSVGQAITSRDAFDDAAIGAPLGSVLTQLSVPLALSPSDEAGAHTLTLGLQGPNDARDPARLNVRRPGVYPVDLELRDADETPIAELRTMLVVAEADRPTVGEPLRVAWVWPMTAAPSFLPDGSPDREVAAAFRPGGRLGRKALALLDHPDVMVTLAPSAETIEAWREMASTDPGAQVTFDALVLAAATRSVLAGPYVPIDLPALLDHGLTAAVDDVLRRGDEVLGPAIGVTPDARTRVLRPASAAALRRLRAAGVDRVVVPADALAPAPETRFTLAQPVVLTGPSEPVTALVTDPGLQAILAADVSPAQRAQLVLAGLSMVALEAPNVPRVVTLLEPDDADEPAALYDALLDGLRHNPYLQPVSVAEAFDTVPTDPPAVLANGNPGSAERELASSTSSAPSVTAAQYRDQRTRLNSFGALTQPGDPGVGLADRSLLASVSNAWPTDIARARAASHLRVVDRVIADLVGRIEVPDPRTITLTSRAGEIPLTFRNDTGFPVRLRAALSSDKLFFPNGSVLELDLPPESTTVRVAVEARTSGTFPLDLEVTSTDGVLPISHRRLEVRSTFVSTVGWVLTASAVAFLALWWGLDLRRRRRRASNPA